MGFAPKWVRGPILGRGSSATVSLAVDSTAGETFAVKSTELSNSVSLQREQRILEVIKSPHVVSYLGFDVTMENDRAMYNLFMEYASGGSVADEIRRRGGGGLEEWKVRSYTRGILMGLSYLHSVGIAHCDVKGKNVLVGSDGVLKIGDLGCAKWVAGDVSDDCQRVVVGGTPAFMAPEVARGEEQGTAADIWAVGCTIIEMATGRMPWSGVDDPFAAVHHIGFSGNLPKLPKSVSDECRDFLGKCLRREASERWSVEQLLCHPFVSSECPENPIWRSPKCILDQDFWNSLEEEEDEREEESNAGEEKTTGPADRLRELGSGGSSSSSVSSSTWDEDDWITVRGEDIVAGSPSGSRKCGPAVVVLTADEVGGDHDGGGVGKRDMGAHVRDCSRLYCCCGEHKSHVGEMAVTVMINKVKHCCYSSYSHSKSAPFVLAD